MSFVARFVCCLSPALIIFNSHASRAARPGAEEPSSIVICEYALSPKAMADAQDFIENLVLNRTFMVMHIDSAVRPEVLRALGINPILMLNRTNLMLHVSQDDPTAISIGRMDAGFWRSDAEPDLEAEALTGWQHLQAHENLLTLPYKRLLRMVDPDGNNVKAGFRGQPNTDGVRTFLQISTEKLGLYDGIGFAFGVDVPCDQVERFTRAPDEALRVRTPALDLCRIPIAWAWRVNKGLE